MHDEDLSELPAEEPAACDMLPLPRWGEFMVIVDQRGTLYTTLAALCDFVRINVNMQRKRAQEHPVIRRHLRRFVIAYEKGGRQPTLCIEVRVAAYWLGSINPKLVREDMQEELIEFQEDLIDAANDPAALHVQRLAPARPRHREHAHSLLTLPPTRKPSKCVPGSGVVHRPWPDGG